MTWAADSRQTAARLRAALDAYRKLPPMPGAADPIRAEAQIVRNTEKLPRSELIEEILLMLSEPRHEVHPIEKLRADVLTTPWELARASKAFRLLYGARIEEAQTEPWFAGRMSTQSGREWPKLRTTSGPDARVIAPDELEQVFTSTPLATLTLPVLESYIDLWNRNEVGRRALVQVLALRAWQLEHGGRLPGQLQELVSSGLLDALPTDPYTPKHPFGYVRSSGQPLLPLGQFARLARGPTARGNFAPPPMTGYSTASAPTCATTWPRGTIRGEQEATSSSRCPRRKPSDFPRAGPGSQVPRIAGT